MVLSGGLSFVGGGTIITIAGGCTALATASIGLSGGGGGIFGCVLLVGVCVCLLLFIQDILVG